MYCIHDKQGQACNHTYRRTSNTGQTCKPIKTCGEHADLGLEPKTFPSSCCEMAVLATVQVTITLKKKILQMENCSVQCDFSIQDCQATYYKSQHRLLRKQLSHIPCIGEILKRPPHSQDGWGAVDDCLHLK